MADIATYLKYRNTFLMLGYNIEVNKLDIYYQLMFLYRRDNKLIKIITNE